MRALLWGVEGDPWTPPPGHEDNPLVANLASSPMSLREVPDPPFVRPDWTVVRPRLAGICGSDSKMALLDFGDEGVDNAMAGLPGRSRWRSTTAEPAFLHSQRREFRSAVAMMVSVGLWAPEVGKTEPSATNRLSSWW